MITNKVPGYHSFRRILTKGLKAKKQPPSRIDIEHESVDGLTCSKGIPGEREGP